MSPSKKAGPTGSASPATPAGATASANPAKPASLTPAEAQQWSYVLKQLDENPWVIRAVIAAGIGAVVEMLHIGWLAWRYFGKF